MGIHQKIPIFLIICNPDFKSKVQAIFNQLSINGNIWCLDLQTMFEAGFSRLFIFLYPDISSYSKILYLDCDILITNSLSHVFDLSLSNKIYALREGNTNHDFYGRMFFVNDPTCIRCTSYPPSLHQGGRKAFSSGILLFNNVPVINSLFKQILLHIKQHIRNNLPIPVCLDQPFIVYHAVKNNLYDNTKLIDLAVNNPKKWNSETISHFPGSPGYYESKIVKMSNFIHSMMFNSKEYWNDRYKKGRNSGSGSFNELAKFKADIINDFIGKNQIKSIVDYGVGDGNQLKLLNTENLIYTGIDVSEFIISKCKEEFKDDKTKQFINSNSINNGLKADLVVSCDVIYHLIEEHVYEDYMENLFSMSQKYVIIYAKDEDINHTVHVKFRKFSNYIENNLQEWKLIKHIPNKYPQLILGQNNDKTSPSDFFIY